MATKAEDTKAADEVLAEEVGDQRAELHRTIWQIANDLRGSVDGWDFKSYVLNMLFYRFVSENLTAYINAGLKSEDPDADFAELDDDLFFDGDGERDGLRDLNEASEAVAREKGFFIPPSQLFCNVQKTAHKNANLNEDLDHIFYAIEKSARDLPSENDFKGLFDDFQVNSSKLGENTAERNKKLAQLLDAIASLPLGDFGDNTIDLFGDAYEYLMQMYASSAGKSGGEFFTPQEVSELLARIAASGKESIDRVYDPACGSGSLLLKFAKVLGSKNVGGFYGQEINITTYNLARMNMFLHNIAYENFDIRRGDTLTSPEHLDDRPFDSIVSNPPYSTKWEGNQNPVLVNDERFSPAGALAPRSKADLAFTMHILNHLDTEGTAAIVEFPGAMYRGGAEQKIREYLVKNNFVHAVIQLPPDLFFGTGIATCILVLKKNKDDNSILFVDGAEYFKRSGNKNKLFEEHQEKIMELYEGREDVKHKAKLVDNEEVIKNSSNLSVNSYVERESTRENIDIVALMEELDDLMAKQAVLRAKVDGIFREMVDEEIERRKKEAEEKDNEKDTEK